MGPRASLDVVTKKIINIILKHALNCKYHCQAKKSYFNKPAQKSILKHILNIIAHTDHYWKALCYLLQDASKIDLAVTYHKRRNVPDPQEKSCPDELGPSKKSKKNSY